MVLHTTLVPPRAGDVVFAHDEVDIDFPWHVGIFVGARGNTSGIDVFLVRGVPRCKTGDLDANHLGDSIWGAEDNFSPRMLGRLEYVGNGRPVDPAELSEVVAISDAVLYELGGLEESQAGLRACGWSRKERYHPTRHIRGGIPLFWTGTCAHFVAHVYRQARLPLVSRPTCHDLYEPERVWPPTLAHVLHFDNAPRAIWDPRLRSFPDCLDVPPLSCCES